MPNTTTFSLVQDYATISALATDWRNSLLAPQDGMWESLRKQASQWVIQQSDSTIGFATVDEDNLLLNFYLQPQYLSDGVILLNQFIEQEKISTALIGTHNPNALTLNMHLQQEVIVDTYLFSIPQQLASPLQPTAMGSIKTSGSAKKPQSADANDLEALVDFYHYSMDGPKTWLRSYLSDLIAKGEVFYLMQEAEIIGACEVRKSKTQQKIADLGMVVSPDHRRKGLGSYLLGEARTIAQGWGKNPICSCEANNIASRKSIEANGFRAVHQLLRLNF